MPLSSDSASLNFGAFGPVITPAATDEFIVEQADGVQRIETRLQIHSLESTETFLASTGVNSGLMFGDGDSGFIEVTDDNLRVQLAGITRYLFEPAQFRTTSVDSFGLLVIGASNIVPNILPSSNDADTGLGQSAADQLSLIAGGVQVANLTESAGVVQLIVPLQNDAANPSIAFGDGNTGFYEQADNALNIAIAGSKFGQFSSAGFEISISNGPKMANVSPSGTSPTLLPSRADLDTGIGWRTANIGVLVAGGVNVQEFGEAGAAPLLGFFGTAAVAQPAGVAVTAAGIHAALVTLGLIT